MLVALLVCILPDLPNRSASVASPEPLLLSLPLNILLFHICSGFLRMPVANTHSTAPRDIRQTLKNIFHDVSGYSLNQQGNFVAEQGTDVQLSDAVERLHRWLKAIFAVLTHHSRESADSLLLLLGAIQEAERGVREARERGTSSDAIADCVLTSLKTPDLRTVFTSLRLQSLSLNRTAFLPSVPK
ncbi:hypothetical protein JCM10296v2_005091 [Rhodotorula toruloides]